MEISVVIPVYNSESCLFELYRQIGYALSDISHEVIMVNDKSKDRSWEKIVDISKNKRNFTGVNLRKNSGQNNAIMAGLRQANGKYIVIMDDDLQQSPYDIKRLYDKVKNEDCDVCFANFLKKEAALWKNIGSWFNGKIAEILISKPRNIYLSPFKIIKNDVIREIIKYDGPYPYIDGLLLSITNNLTQIDLKHSKRFKGSSNYSLMRSITVFMKLATSFSVIPLRAASFIGFITSILGFLLGCYFVVLYFFSSNRVEGWTALVVINLFLGGLLLVFLGIVGEYIGRAYLKLNNKPQYTIKDIIKNDN